MAILKLHYKKYGESGDVVFILHGLFGMLDNWHNIARALSERFQVYSIDARNHGQSPHSSEMGYSIMAADVMALADDLEIRQFILMGHSMGGKTAMLCALMHPERIQKLVVVDIAPKAYKPGHAVYFRAFEEIPWHTLETRKAIDEALSAYEDNAGVRLFLAKNIDRLETGGFAVKSNVPAIKAAYNEIIGSYPLHGIYAQPALFVTGADSAYLLESDKAAINSHFTKAVYKQIPNAGHWVHADNPSVFLAVLSEFLS